MIRGMVESLVTYVLAGPSLVDDIQSAVGGLDPSPPEVPRAVWVCREPPAGVMPEALAPSGAVLLTESWGVDVVWLGRALDAGLDSTKARFVVVRVVWPLNADAESVL